MYLAGSFWQFGEPVAADASGVRHPKGQGMIVHQCKTGRSAAVQGAAECARLGCELI
jgi:hypothetical protein